jgi:hypothetical protein
MGTWLNSDGLYVKLGTSEATVAKGGETAILGDRREIVFSIPDMTALTTGSAILTGVDTFVIPKGARIEEVEVEVLTGCTGATATLNLGLIRTDRSTALDADGLVAVAAVATLDTAGKRLNLINGSTAAGALIGTTLANSGILVADWDTAAFTAGAIRVRVRFFFP